MSKATYFIIGAAIIGGAAYIFRDKLFPSKAEPSYPTTPESEASDFSIRGAVAGAASAVADAVGFGGLDEGAIATLHLEPRIMTAPAPRLTLAALVGAAPRTAAA